MKKITFIILTLSLSFVLLGCQSSKDSQKQEQAQKKALQDNEQIQQKIIIMDSVEEPLPPEAENVQTMPGKAEPQQLPNADISKPIVITKMPTTENKMPNVNGQ
ncbi:hypothetical protein EQV77_13080 [Halobacillus fulvus]|nr:hypothetical protein EQV77_13080 [Halobacillus fulvus]